MTQSSRQRFASALTAASLSLALLVTSSPAALAAEKESPSAPVVAPPEKGGPAAGGTVMEVKVTREEAVALATKLFPIPKELGEPNVNKTQSKEGATWNLDWSTPEKEPVRTNISINVDAISGVVLGYYKNTYDPDATVVLPSYTKAEARKTADAWFAKLIGATGQTYKLQENGDTYGYYGPVEQGYSFNWVRMEQGYPARNESVSIAIDARTGELRSFNRFYGQKLTYTLPAALLTQTKAEALYKSNVEMALYWQHFQPAGVDKGEWRLVYRPLTGFLNMDQTGKLLDYSGQTVDLSQRAPMTRVPAPDKPYTKPAKPLTEVEALALAKDVAGRTDEPTAASYSEYGKDANRTTAWNFNWNLNREPKEGEYNTNVSIDAVRGIVVNYGQWGSYQPMKQDEKPKVTTAEAREIAVNFIRKVRPDLAANLMLMPGDPQEEARAVKYGNTSYNVSFTGLRDGILVADQTASVNVDVRNGKVQNFWYNDISYVKDEFPAVPATLLKPADAINSFLTYQGIELAWNLFYGDPYEMKMSGKTTEPTVQLVWTPSTKLSVNMIDAVTGVPLDWEGRDLAELSKVPTDIEGTAAQREIELLWPRRIFDLKDGKFRPNEAATAADLARWLVLARGMRPYVAYSFDRAFDGMGAGGALMAKNMAATAAAPYFGAALQNGIILPEDFGNSTDPNAPVSRETFVLWVARAMGYSSVAKMPNRIEMNLNDKNMISARCANAVALLNGLGYLKGDSVGNFFPTQSITRGDAAKYLFAVVAEVRR